MLLSLPSDDNHDNIGVWRLERKFETDEYTKLAVPFMEWKVFDSIHIWELFLLFCHLVLGFSDLLSLTRFLLVFYQS